MVFVKAMCKEVVREQGEVGIFKGPEVIKGWVDPKGVSHFVVDWTVAKSMDEVSFFFGETGCTSGFPRGWVFKMAMCRFIVGGWQDTKAGF